jgi:hypothetical protein
MKDNKFDFNYKDQNKWKSEQEVVIARRKTRGSKFFLRIFFVLYILFLGYVIALYDSPPIEKNHDLVILILIGWLVIMLLLLLRIKYLSYKYKD